MFHCLPSSFPFPKTYFLQSALPQTVPRIRPQKTMPGRIIFGPSSLKVRPDQILYKKGSGFYKKIRKERSGEEKCIFNLK